MSSIISLKILRLGFDFYKKFFLISILITIFLLYTKPPIGTIVTIGTIFALKLLFAVIIFLAYLEPKLQQQLIYYKNFGLSKVTLVVISLLIDIILTLAVVLIIHLF